MQSNLREPRDQSLTGAVDCWSADAASLAGEEALVAPGVAAAVDQAALPTPVERVAAAGAAAGVLVVAVAIADQQRVS